MARDIVPAASRRLTREDLEAAAEQARRRRQAQALAFGPPPLDQERVDEADRDQAFLDWAEDRTYPGLAALDQSGVGEFWRGAAEPLLSELDPVTHAERGFEAVEQGDLPRAMWENLLYYGYGLGGALPLGSARAASIVPEVGAFDDIETVAGVIGRGTRTGGDDAYFWGATGEAQAEPVVDWAAVGDDLYPPSMRGIPERAGERLSDYTAEWRGWNDGPTPGYTADKADFDVLEEGRTILDRMQRSTGRLKPRESVEDAWAYRQDRQREDMAALARAIESGDAAAVRERLDLIQSEGPSEYASFFQAGETGRQRRPRDLGTSLDAYPRIPIQDMTPTNPVEPPRGLSRVEQGALITGAGIGGLAAGFMSPDEQEQEEFVPPEWYHPMDRRTAFDLPPDSLPEFEVSDLPYPGGVNPAAGDDLPMVNVPQVAWREFRPFDPESVELTAPVDFRTGAGGIDANYEPPPLLEPGRYPGGAFGDIPFDFVVRDPKIGAGGSGDDEPFLVSPDTRFFDIEPIDSPNEIRDYQTRLEEAGYPPGPIDGRLGPLTGTAGEDMALGEYGVPAPEDLTQRYQLAMGARKKPVTVADIQTLLSRDPEFAEMLAPYGVDDDYGSRSERTLEAAFPGFDAPPHQQDLTPQQIMEIYKRRFLNRQPTAATGR